MGGRERGEKESRGKRKTGKARRGVGNSFLANMRATTSIW